MSDYEGESIYDECNRVAGMTLGEFLKLIDERGYVFWMCPKGCRQAVEWNEDRTRATCQNCGGTSDETGFVDTRNETQ